MHILLRRVRDGVNTIVYGRSTVTCETCGTGLRPSRAVWRGARPYCSAQHEHDDFDL